MSAGKWQVSTSQRAAERSQSPPSAFPPPFASPIVLAVTPSSPLQGNSWTRLKTRSDVDSMAFHLITETASIAFPRPLPFFSDDGDSPRVLANEDGRERMEGGELNIVG